MAPDPLANCESEALIEPPEADRVRILGKQNVLLDVENREPDQPGHGVYPMLMSKRFRETGILYTLGRICVCVVSGNIQMETGL